jgi:ADP-dependent NAD(P)H-hydrate dehydratase / NAD(P)H-hydrate epimerase
MQKILTAEQIRRADAWTIEHEPVSSIDLMERAALACAEWLMRRTEFLNRDILIFCGPGNNGGDGLAMARLLHEQKAGVRVFLPADDGKRSPDFLINLERARSCGFPLLIHTDFNPLPSETRAGSLLVDALFGSGLNHPPEGAYRDLILKMNACDGIRIAIDLPSGLSADQPSGPGGQAIVKAGYTLSFQTPKLAFLMSENEFYAGEWHVLPIGLHTGFLDSEPCRNFLTEAADLQAILRPRPRFSHKGTYGHALLIGGSSGKAGAAVLMTRACLRSGAGLVTTHIPACNYEIQQVSAPEAMASVDPEEKECSRLPALGPFTALAAGPGMGTGPGAAALLKHLIQEARVPLLLDADALNLLAENPTWMAFLPPGTVLTPHPGEFARLAGKSRDSFERLEKARELSTRFGLYIVLKGAFTLISSPSGKAYFNPSGNPGMAGGGSGDVLTGILAGLLAQGYPPLEACLLGTYIHGRAGDHAAAESGYEALTAGDIIQHLGKAFLELYGAPDADLEAG